MTAVGVHHKLFKDKFAESVTVVETDPVAVNALYTSLEPLVLAFNKDIITAKDFTKKKSTK